MIAACGAEELQRLRVCDRLLHLLSTLKSRPHNHSFIYILFDIMLKSATYHQPSFITSSSSCYKYPLVEKFSKKPILEPVQLMSDGGVSEESVASAEDPVAKTTTSSPKRGQVCPLCYFIFQNDLFKKILNIIFLFADLFCLISEFLYKIWRILRVWKVQTKPWNVSLKSISSWR